MVLFILGAVSFFVVQNVRSSVGNLVLADSMQICTARADEVGELMEKLRWQINVLSLQPQVRGADRKVVAPFLMSLEGKFSPEVASIYFAWPDGTDVTSAGGVSNLKDRDYFKSIMLVGADSAVGAPVIAKSLGIPIIPMAQAIRNEKGQTIGIVACSMKLEKFSEIVSDIKVGQGGYGWVVDETGLVLAHPQKDTIMKVNMTQADKSLGYKGLDAFSQKLLADDSGYGRYIDPNGVPIISFFARVPHTPGWRLGINMPYAEVQAASSSLLRIFIIVIALAMILSIVLALFLGKSLAAPINQVVASFKELAEGEADLTKVLSVDRKDELGDLATDFNFFIDRLRGIVVTLKTAQDELENIGEELRSSADGTAGSVTQISERIKDVSDKAQRQSASVESSSSAVEQIARSIDSLERLVTDQAASVTEASAAIEEMVGNIGSVTGSIGKMADEFTSLSSAAEEGRATQEATGASIVHIAERSEALREANTAIAKIASQTNLLAMNAAIEAAHAGEAGKGFSVVADEIRSLAETSAKQSRSIGTELSQIGKEIEDVVTASRASEESFARVMERIQGVDRVVREVKGAMTEQKEGSIQILEALKSMNEITSNVRTGSKEMSQGNATVLGEMEGLKGAAADIKASMEAMANEASAIAAGARKVSIMAEGTSSTITRMDEAIGRFTV
jgi:methyl-accepting chemotaxis protein